MSRPAIRSHADIASRCTRDERTGCLNWMGFAKGERGRPQMYLHDIGHVVSPDKMLHFLAREAGPVRQRDERRIYHPMCGNHLCCERAHHKLLTKGQINRLRRGVVTAVSRAKISQSRKAAGRGRITPEQRAEIKGSSMSLKEIAARYSVSITYACVLRSGRADVPRDRAGLMPGLAAGASVFAWGGAA